ncbi:hypothetical protein Glove_621g2 [Diversispora epigaea]|uniref:Uncharacterized protein n=1 Tax=Diversispora epigaea TaxID=1348612 RepID=A0A397G610_9GLOM|nr:hypothetical protein Glove_621g2 [Diversispora epigaea]
MNLVKESDDDESSSTQQQQQMLSPSTTTAEKVLRITYIYGGIINIEYTDTKAIYELMVDWNLKNYQKD